MVRSRIKLWLFSVAISFVIAAPNVKAAAILIDAKNITALVTFTFNQFEGGFSINGSTPTSGGSFTFGEGTQLNFTGQWLDLGSASSFARTVYWVDPQQGASTIDHILQWSITPSGPSGLATISGFFQAEGLGTLPPGANPADIIIEQQDDSHNPFQFSAPFLSGQIIADLCGDDFHRNDPLCFPAQVPEPSIIALFAAGLFGLGFARRRIRS